MKLTKGEREVDDVSDCGDKNRCAFLEKPSGDRIRIRMLVRTEKEVRNVCTIIIIINRFLDFGAFPLRLWPYGCCACSWRCSENRRTPVDRRQYFQLCIRLSLY